MKDGHNIFAKLYCLFFIFYTGFTDSWFSGLFPTISLLLALIVLIQQQGPRFLVWFIISFSIQILIMMPDIPNVIFFSLIVNLTIFIHFLRCQIKKQSFNVLDLRHLILIELAILYLFTFFHKLNYSFLDIECSCASYLVNEILEHLPFVNAPDLFYYFIIYLTLLIELALPVLLLWKRTRKASLLFGLLFHSMLARSHYDFSALIFALYSLYLPTNIYNLSFQKSKPIVKIVQILLLIAVGIGWAYSFMFSYRLFMILWYCFALIFLGNLFINRFKIIDHTVVENEPVVFPFYYYLLPFVLIFNGMNPYLGLKTEYSFAMYSNLRTELGKSNHILLGNSLKVFSFQEDVVYLIDSNLPGVDSHHFITYFDFIKLIDKYEGHKNYYLKYKYDDKITLYKFDDSIHLRKYPLFGLLKKYLKFRQIQSSDKVKCVH